MRRQRSRDSRCWRARGGGCGVDARGSARDEPSGRSPQGYTTGVGDDAVSYACNWRSREGDLDLEANRAALKQADVKSVGRGISFGHSCRV